MNPAYKEALAIVVRQLLISAGTAIGLTGVLTPFLGELTNTIVAALVVLIGAGWAQLVQRLKRLKLLQSLGIAGISEGQVEALVKSATVSTPAITTPKHEVPK